VHQALLALSQGCTTCGVSRSLSWTWAGRDDELVGNTLDALRNDSWKVETAHPHVMSDVSCSNDGLPNEFRWGFRS
jgi:hypothetical protein